MASTSQPLADTASQRQADPAGRSTLTERPGRRTPIGSGVDDPMRRRHRPPQRPIFAGRYGAEHASWWSAEPDVDRVAHGVPARVDRLRALGNAVVPQVAEYVGRQIVEAVG
jgi:DNA (cytosine-5)-methyltransferase 1